MFLGRSSLTISGYRKRGVIQDHHQPPFKRPTRNEKEPKEFYGIENYLICTSSHWSIRHCDIYIYKGAATLMHAPPVFSITDLIGFVISD